MSNNEDSRLRQKFDLRMAILILVGMVVLVLSGVCALLIWRGLTVHEISTTLASIATTLGGVASVVLMLMRLQGTTDQQTQLLSKIDDQTNGILTEKIHSAIMDELDHRSMVNTASLPVVTKPEGIKGRGVQQSSQ